LPLKQLLPLPAGLWAKCLRKGINHRDDDTTAICEGFHSVIKSLLRATGGEGQRVDKLIYFLLNTVSEMFTYREVRRHYCALFDSSGMLHTYDHTYSLEPTEHEHTLDSVQVFHSACMSRCLARLTT
jgi:hypothetical protein